MKTGRPQVVDRYSTAHQGEDVNTTNICPAALGTKDQQPAAYDRLSGLFMVPTNHVCMDYEPFKVDYVAGNAYVGATLSMYPAPGGTHLGVTSLHGMLIKVRLYGLILSHSLYGVVL